MLEQLKQIPRGFAILGLVVLFILYRINFEPLSVLLALVVTLAIMGYYSGRQLSLATGRGSANELLSLPAYHGMFVAFSIFLPGMAMLLAWVVAEPTVIRTLVMWPLSDLLAGRTTAQVDLLYARISGVGVAGLGASTREQALLADAVANYDSLRGTSRNLMIAAVLAVAGLGGYLGMRRIKVDFRARERVEGITKGLMIACAVVAILTTLGIVFSLIGESILFFTKVPVGDFLFGLRWSPQEALRADQAGSSGAFGALPLLLGTGLIGLIALLVAVPLGLLSAIYLAEYATSRVRNTLKPVLEILAGIPTVVYGFFAILVIAPLFPPIERGWASMMDTAIERLFEGRLAAASASERAEGVPVVLPSGVVTIREEGLRDVIDRMSKEDRAAILDAGTDVFEITVTPANANGVTGLLPIQERTALLTRLGGLNERIIEVNNRLADLVNTDGRFDELLGSAPEGLSPEDQRERAKLDRIRGQLITQVNALIDIQETDDRQDVIAGVLAQLQLDRVNPYRLVEAKTQGLEPDQRVAFFRRSPGLEQGESIALEGLAQRVVQDPGLPEATRTTLATDITGLMDVEEAQRAARIAHIAQRYRAAVGAQIAQVDRQKIADEIAVASREVMGVDDAALEEIAQSIRSLVEEPQRSARQATAGAILARLEASGVPSEARRDIETLLEGLESRFALIDRRAAEARDAYEDEMGNAARDLREALEAAEQAKRTAERGEAAEAAIEAMVIRLSEAATDRLLTAGEQEALLNLVEDYPSQSPEGREQTLATLRAQVAGIDELRDDHRLAIQQALDELEQTVARGDAAAQRLATDMGNLVERFEGDLANLTADVEAANPSIANQNTAEILLAGFTADYAVLAEERSALFAEIDEAASSLHPTPEVEAASGYGWRSVFYWIFGITFLGASANSAIAAGLVMGVMIIPLVTSLSDDVINAVPQTLRDGSPTPWGPPNPKPR